jgi:hypothetical protein
MAPDRWYTGAALMAPQSPATWRDLEAAAQEIISHDPIPRSIGPRLCYNMCRE